MKSLAALSLLFLFSSIRAAALPKLIDSELESQSKPLERDTSGNLIPRSPQRGSSELEYEGSKPKSRREVVVPMTDDTSPDPFSNLKRDISARDPQGPASNPGEFIGVGLSRVNPANHNSSAKSSSPSLADSGQKFYTITGGFDPKHVHEALKLSHGWRPGRKLLMGDGTKMEHNREHRKDGVLTEFSSHGEHIVVYNGTHFPNGTRYSPANETMDGGKMLEKVIVDGDEVVVYRKPGNDMNYHHNRTRVWLPSGTGWIPSGTERPNHHRKVPSAASAGFRGPKAKRHGRFSEDEDPSAGEVVYGK